MSRLPGNPIRMDVAALDLTCVSAVTPATRKPTLAERMGAWFNRAAVSDLPAEPGAEVYTWHSVETLIGGAR